MFGTTRRFQIVFFSVMSLISILAFQNCSSPDVGKNEQSESVQVPQDSSFCASITNQELVYDINFGDPLNIEVPFTNSCSGPVKFI